MPSREPNIQPKKSPGKPIKVVHRVNQKLVTTECKSVRDSNVSGFIELLDVKGTNLQDVLGEELLNEAVESLVLPKIVVVAICYPMPDGDDRVVLLHPQEHLEDDLDHVD